MPPNFISHVWQSAEHLWTDFGVKEQDALAKQYPVPGVINDTEDPDGRPNYVMAPDYVNFAPPPKQMYMPWGPGRVYTPAPPALWWAQRDTWQNKWRQLADDGDMVPSRSRYIPRRTRKVSERHGVGYCNPAPGPLPVSSLNKTHWWKWLAKDDVPEKRSVLDAAAPDMGCPKELKWKDKIAGKHPASYKWVPEVLPPEVGRITKEEARARLDRLEDAEAEEMLTSGRFQWDQEEWVRRHSMRVPTIWGFPEVLGPRGRNQIIPQIERFSTDMEPATLDPWLPRPDLPPSPHEVPAGSSMDQYLLQPFSTDDRRSTLANAAKKEMKKQMNSMYGPYSPLSLKALMRVMKEEPEFGDRFMYRDDDPGTTSTDASSAVATGLATDAGANGAAALWQPTPVKEFKDKYREGWRDFWPSAVRAQANGSRAASEGERVAGMGTVAELGLEFLASKGMD